MPPKIDTFIKCLKDYNFLTIFDKWETYLWSNFPYNYTWDIDIIFIGEPSEELGEKIIDFQKYVKTRTNMKIDEQVFKDTKVFSYIPEMNKGDVDLKNIFKYKTKELNSPRIYRDEPKKINKYFWEFNLLGLNEKCKFRHSKANIHYPILIEDFIKLVFNIKNSDIYNTDKDISYEKYKKLNRQFRKQIYVNR